MLCIALAAWWGWPKGAPSITSAPQPAARVAPGGTNTPAPRLSIVVLPFTNLSNDPEQEYFADGVTDDLTTDLSRIADSFVIARNTAFTYKGKSVDAKQIGRELGVRYVLEGSVRRTGDQVHMNVQLIDAETGAHVWADRFDTSRANLAEAQSEITGSLARTLNAELVRDIGRRIEQEKAINPDARDMVMRGWAWWYHPASLVNRQEAQRAFERALELDPVSVDANIGIASMLAANIVDGWSSSVEQDKARAEQLLIEALGRDVNSDGVAPPKSEPIERSEDGVREGDRARPQQRVGNFPGRANADVAGSTRGGNPPYREKHPAGPALPEYGHPLLGIGCVPSPFGACG
jgi:TolB-like protein